jgi:hypothetical protein
MGLFLFLEVPVRIRKIAVLIKGRVFIKHLPKLVAPHDYDSASAVADSPRLLRTGGSIRKHRRRLARLDSRSRPLMAET